MTLTGRRPVTESVEVLDEEVQAAWRQMARSGVAELTSSYVLCTTLAGLAEAGIAEKLSEDWVALDDLVPPGGSAVMIGQVMRYLGIRGIAESAGDAWRLTPRGASLVSELPGALVGYYAQAYGPVLGSMAGQLTGAEPYGTRVHRDAEALGRHCEVLFRSFGTTLVAGLITEHGASSVLDLGCGTGGLVLDLCRAYPGLRAVGLDIAPDAVRYAQARAAEAGLQDRVSFVVGDAFAPADWPAEAAACDFFVAVGAVHEHFRDGEAAVVELLRRYAALLGAPGGKTLLLAEPELNVDAADADFFLVHVLTAQGMPRRRAGWFEVFERAGLRCTRVFSAPNTGFRFAYYELRAAGH